MAWPRAHSGTLDGSVTGVGVGAAATRRVAAWAVAGGAIWPGPLPRPEFHSQITAPPARHAPAVNAAAGARTAPRRRVDSLTPMLRRLNDCIRVFEFLNL